MPGQGSRLSKKLKTVAVGGHAPDDGDTDRKILRQIVCEERLATSARFAVKFCRRGFQRAAEPSTACGGYSEAEQGQRSQSASAIYGTPRDAGTATRRNRRVRQLPCAAVAPFAACRVSRHAETLPSPGQGSFLPVRHARTPPPALAAEINLRPPRKWGMIGV